MILYPAEKLRHHPTRPSKSELDVGEGHDVSCEHRTEPDSPVPHSFMTDIDPGLPQQVFDIAQRQRKAHIHHHQQTNERWRRVEAFEWAVWLAASGRRPSVP